MKFLIQRYRIRFSQNFDTMLSFIAQSCNVANRLSPYLNKKLLVYRTFLFSELLASCTKKSNMSQFNLTGHPALSINCGFSDAAGSSGLPIGVQIVGRMNEDNIVLQVAYAFERPDTIQLN